MTAKIFAERIFGHLLLRWTFCRQGYFEGRIFRRVGYFWREISYKEGYFLDRIFEILCWERDFVDKDI